MREQDFDPKYELELSELLGELPPDEELVKHITPWRTAIDRIVTGLALTTITLNFLWLKYLLPLIGTVMLFLGFRSLRRENRGFRLCYVLSAVRLIWNIASLIVSSTIWQSRIFAALDNPAADGVALAVNFLFLIFLRQGLRAVRKKAGLAPACESMNMLILWTAVLCALAFVKYQGLVVGIFIIIMYVFIIKSLAAVAAELDEAGYDIVPAPVKVEDGRVKKAVAAVVLAGVVLGYVFFHSYPMDWEKKAETAYDADVRAAYDHLVSLGFPEYVLSDLTDEDILSCKGAKRIIWDVYDNPVNEGREVTVREGNMVQVHREYDVKELRTTGIAVELDTRRESWRIFHHFLWTTDPGIHGTESLQLWPAYRRTEGWTEADSPWTGRLCYDYDGATYVGDYFAMNEKTYSGVSFFGDAYTSTDVFAEFSFPRRAENQRGYVSYVIDELNDGYIIDSWINYTHQDYFFQYPVLTAKDKQMQGGFDRSGCFFRVQDALQFYPNDSEPLTFRQEHGKDYN